MGPSRPITYPSYDASQHEGEVEHQLFGEDADLRKSEDRRWDLTINHWDLSVHEVDPHQGSDWENCANAVRRFRSRQASQRVVAA